MSVAVRLLPELPKIMPLFGMRFVFEDIPVRVRRVAGVSASVTMNLIGWLVEEIGEKGGT